MKSVSFTFFSMAMFADTLIPFNASMMTKSKKFNDKLSQKQVSNGDYFTNHLQIIDCVTETIFWIRKKFISICHFLICINFIINLIN